MSHAARCVLPLSILLALTGCQSQEQEATAQSRTFDATHTFVIDVPPDSPRLQAWFPVPADWDQDQDVVAMNVDAPYETRVVRDTQGNNFLFLEAERPAPGPLTVKTQFTVRRREIRADIDPSKTRPHTSAELISMAPYLRGSNHTVIDDDVRRFAADATGGERNPVIAGRRIYDAVLDRIEYHVKDPKPDAQKTMMASGKGDSRFTLEKCTGNCTDFHALWAAAAMSQNIPTRVVYGSFFKGPLNGADKDQSYHCWVEFHAPNLGWIPLDVAVADVFTADFQANEHSRPRAHLTVADGYNGPDAHLVGYYFGNLEDRRVTWHRGRDLEMVGPRQAGPPLLWNPNGYAEVGGRVIPVSRKLTFTERG